VQLDSVFIRASSAADITRLKRAGAEVWQERGCVTSNGGVRWEYAVLKVPAAAAIRLHLVALDEVQEVADYDSTPAKPPRRPRNQRSTPTPTPPRLADVAMTHRQKGTPTRVQSHVTAPRQRQRARRSA
jgi:hypothetical protein